MQEAIRAGQPYVTKRWLGGMLTNFVTIKKRIGLLDQLEARQQAGDFDRLPKKEAALLTEELNKLQAMLGGIRKMKRLPGAVFIVDPHRERIAVTEANKLEIPVVGTGDTNVDPDELDYIIPANDDAIRAIRLLCQLVADAAIEGARERAVRASAEPEARSPRRSRSPSSTRRAAADLVAAARRGRHALFEPDLEDEDLLPGGPRRREAGARPRPRSRPAPAPCRRAGRSRTRPHRRPPPTPTSRATGRHDVRPRPRRPTEATERAPAHARPPARALAARRQQTGASAHGDHRRGSQGAARANRRGHDGLQARAGGDRRRHREGDRAAARAGPRRGRQAEGRSRGERGARRQLHPHGRAVGVADRGQLRDRLRRPHRRVPEARPGPRDAGRRRRAAVRRRDGIPEDVLAGEEGGAPGRRGRRASPRPIREKIIEGQLKQVVQGDLPLEQPFRDDDRTVGDLVTEPIATIGENIRVRRFARYALGEECAEAGREPDAPRGPTAAPAAGRLRYRRILLKLSGEALLGERQYGVDPASARSSPARSPTSARWASRSASWSAAATSSAARRVGRGDGPRHRRLHRHAGDRDERARAPGCPGAARASRRG